MGDECEEEDDDKEDDDDDDEDENEEVDNLYREATMPLDQVMAQYADNPQLARLKQGEDSKKSPFLKAKKTGEGSNSDVGPPIKMDLSEADEEESSKAEGSLKTEDKSQSSSAINAAKENGDSSKDEVKKESTDSKEVNGDSKKDNHIVNGDIKEEKDDKKNKENLIKNENGDCLNGDELKK